MTEEQKAVLEAAKEVHHTALRLDAGIKDPEFDLASLGELRIEFSHAIKRLRERAARLEAAENDNSKGND